MLVLTRRIGEEIVIGDNIRVKVVAIRAGKVRLAVTAPQAIVVDREEVRVRRSELVAKDRSDDVASMLLRSILHYQPCAAERSRHVTT